MAAKPKPTPEETPAETQAVATRPRVDEPAPYNPALETWEEATSAAHEVMGHDLAKDELLDALIGVPFLITRFTFRPGIPASETTQFMAKGDTYAYVSVEAVIAPEVELKRRRVNVDTLPFDPGALVVFNDGSTGIYRQTVNYLEAIGFITLPEGPDEGSKGSVRFDLPPTKWTEVHAGELSFDEDGNGIYTVNVRLRCPRGLRKSTYDSPFGEAGTRYLG